MNNSKFFKKIKERISENGFSLIELVVAVGILAILVVLGVVGYRGITEHSRETSVAAAADSVFKAAIARNSDGNTKTDPLDTDDEWMNSAAEDNKVQVQVEKTADGLKVSAWYDEGGTKQYLVERSIGSDSGSENGDDENNEVPPPNTDLIVPINCGTAHPLLCDYLKSDYQYSTQRSTPQIQRLITMRDSEIALSDAETTELNEASTLAQQNFQAKEAAGELVMNDSAAYDDIVDRSARAETSQGLEISSKVISASEAYISETKNLDTDNNYADPEKVEALYISFLNVSAEYLNYLLS